MPTKVICLANHKGGVGKTTTAITLAHGLARRGKETLIVDFDPQGQAASFLGINPGMDVFYLLISGLSGSPTGSELTALKQRVRSTGRPHLWIIPGGAETAAAQQTIGALSKPISYIADILKPFSRNGLDYIILDTSPSLGGLQERAIWASDYVIAPVSPEFAALDGLSQLTQKTLLRLKQDLGWSGTLLGILPTFFDEQTRETRSAMADLHNSFAELVMCPIHRATVLRECAAEAMTLFEKAPDHRVAQEYQKLVNLVLKAD